MFDTGEGSGTHDGAPVVSLSPLSLDPFAIMRDGERESSSRSARCALSARVVARAAARGDVGLRLAALLALLPLDRDTAELGTALGEGGLLDAVEAIARLEGHLAGRRQRVLAALDALPADPPPAGAESPIAADSVGWASLVRANRASSVATRCGISPYLGSLALRRAAALVPGGSLRPVGAALESGSITGSKAELIADELLDVDDPLLARDILHAVLPTAGALGLGRLRDAIRAEVACAHEAETTTGHASAAALREVSRPQEFGVGLASMQIVGPSAEVAHLWARVSHAAESLRPHAGDESINALRFDAIVALVTRGSAGSPGTGRDCSEQARRPAINVVVGLGTLLGADDQPAELEGLGLIDARAARQLAADPTGTWRRLLVDHDGRLIRRSRAYRPPPSMADFILSRDRTCRFPGCRRTRLDVDHIVEHDRGGPTHPANLAALCRTHHNLKTHGLWDYRIDPDSGDARWIDRHGHIAIQPVSRYRRPRHKGIARRVDQARASRQTMRAAPSHNIASMGLAPMRANAAAADTSDLSDDRPPFYDRPPF